MSRKSDFMTLKEFLKWCDDRWHDGCWGPGVAMTCIAIMEDIRNEPFWRRKKRWAEINEDNNVYNAIIQPINKKIQEYNLERLEHMMDERAERAHTDKDSAV